MADIHSLVLKSDSTQIKQSSNDLDKLSNAAKKADNSSNNFSKTTKNTTQSLLGMKTVVTSLIAVLGVDKVIKYADSWSLVNSRLQLATDSTVEFSKAQSELFEIAQDTRQEFTATADLYSRMARATKSLGVSQNDLLTVTNSVNQALVVSGASAQEASSVITQLGQGLASGVLRGEEFNSIMENGSRVALALADSIGVGLGELRAMAKDGKLTSEVVVKALTDQAGAIDSEFNRMAVTVSQSWTTVGNSIMQTVGNLDDATSASSSLASKIMDFSGLIDDNQDAIIDFGIATVATIDKIIDGFDLLQETAEFGIESIILVPQIGLQKFIGVINKQILDIKEAANSVARAVGKDALFDNQSILNSIAAIDKARIKEILLYQQLKKEAKEVKVSFDEWNVSIDERISKLVKENKERERRKDIDLAWAKAVKEFDAYDPDFDDAPMEDRTKAEQGFLDWYDDQWTELNKTLAQQMGESLEDEIHSAFSNIRDFDDFTDALGSAVSSSLSNVMAQAASQYIGLMSGSSILGALGGGLVGGGVGMIASSLFGGDNGQSSAEKAQDKLNEFLDGLDKASQALMAFGNVGSAVGGTIEELQTEISTEGVNLSELSGVLTEIKSGGIRRDELLEEFGYNQLKDRIEASKGLIADYEEELSDVITSSLADTLEIASLTATQIDNLVSSIDITTMEAYDARLNDIALAMKLNTASADDITEATEILSNTNYQYYKDVEEAIEIQKKNNEVLEETKDLSAEENESLKERMAFTWRLNSAVGTLALTRQMELDATDASNRELLKSIHAQEDIQAVLAERIPLEDELARVGLSNIELRELDILLINEENRGLQSSIWAKEDAIEAELEMQRVVAKAQEDLINRQIDGYKEQETALNDYLSSVMTNISSLEGALSSTQGIIGDLRGSDFQLQEFYESMSRTQSLSSGGDFEAFAKSLQETTSMADVLSDIGAFGDVERDMLFAQGVVANQFEALESTTLEQIDYLKMIEENTSNSLTKLDSQIEKLSEQLAALSDIDNSVADVDSSVIDNSSIDTTLVEDATGSLDGIDSNTDGLDAANSSSWTQMDSLTRQGARIAFATEDAVSTDYDSIKTSNQAIRAMMRFQNSRWGWSGNGSEQLQQFAVGTTSVSHDMNARVHQGEIIVPSNFSDGLRGGDLTMGNQTEVIVELKKNNQMMSAQNQILRKLLVNNKETLDETELTNTTLTKQGAA